MIAYAIQYDRLYRDWSLVTLPERDHVAALAEREPIDSEDSIESAPVGTCIEGIRVEFSSPGFAGRGALAIANASGLTAPKTNVARSSLEDTEEKSNLLSGIYDIYVSQLQSEAHRLVQEEHYSLSWAAGQIPYLAAPLLGTRKATREDLLAASFARLPMYLLEDSEGRRMVSLDALVEMGEFWSISSPLTNSIENLVREMPGNITARSLLETQSGSIALPQGPIVSNLSFLDREHKSLLQTFEVKEIHGFEAERRIDFRWGRISKDPEWLSEAALFAKLSNQNSRLSRDILRMFMAPPSWRLRQRASIFIPKTSVEISGLDEFTAVESAQSVFLCPGTPITNYLRSLFLAQDFEAARRCLIYLQLMRRVLTPQSRDDAAKKLDLERMLRNLGDLQEHLIDQSEFSDAVMSSSMRVLNPFAWSRRSGDDDDDDDDVYAF